MGFNGFGSGGTQGPVGGSGGVTLVDLDPILDGYGTGDGLSATEMDAILDGYQLDLGLTREQLDTAMDGYQLDLGLNRSQLDAAVDGYLVSSDLFPTLDPVLDGYLATADLFPTLDTILDGYDGGGLDLVQLDPILDGYQVDLGFTPASFDSLMDGYGSGSGANTALSNLVTTTINTSLIPGVSDGYDLGSSTYKWKDAYLSGSTYLGDGYGDKLTIYGHTEQPVKDLTYSATTTIDFAQSTLQSVTLTGNVTFATSNLVAGRSVSLRVVCDGTNRTLTFPSGWVFLGTKPSGIIAGKTGILSLVCYVQSDVGIVAAYAVQD